MSNTKYYTNGTLDDPSGTGITLVAMAVDADGNFTSGLVDAETGRFSPGYLANEISYEEYLAWENVIRAPDMVDYFPGVFKGVGVVDKITYDRIAAEFMEARLPHIKQAIEDYQEKFNLISSLVQKTGLPEKFAALSSGIADLDACRAEIKEFDLQCERANETNLRSKQ